MRKDFEILMSDLADAGFIQSADFEIEETQGGRLSVKSWNVPELARPSDLTAFMLIQRARLKEWLSNEKPEAKKRKTDTEEGDVQEIVLEGPTPTLGELVLSFIAGDNRKSVSRIKDVLYRLANENADLDQVRLKAARELNLSPVTLAAGEANGLVTRLSRYLPFTA